MMLNPLKTLPALMISCIAITSAEASPPQNPMQEPPASAEYYSKWSNGPAATNDYFPICVWLQSPHQAAKYKQIGINTYIGLWQGPTQEQLSALEKSGMKLICEQNDVALKNRQSNVIIGYMQQDEPDNAQELPGGKGYGPPVNPAEVAAQYEKIKKADPTRPVILNLGQGVAWDGWYGRGVRTNHPEDYAPYMRGGDIVSFDIYPVAASQQAIAGKLELVSYGVERLRQWSGNQKMIWCCIETTKIDNPSAIPDPAKVRSEVWMAIISGARGLIYFSHQFKPSFIEAGLLADANMAKQIGELNQQIAELAPVINNQDLHPYGVRADAPAAIANLRFMIRRYQGFVYIFSANLSNQPIESTLQIGGSARSGNIEVIGEKRNTPISINKWRDTWEGYGVHLYKIKE